MRKQIFLALEILTAISTLFWCKFATCASVSKQTGFFLMNEGNVETQCLRLLIRNHIVYPACINKQTEFFFANAGTSCKLAPKERIILRISASSAGKENNLPQNTQKIAEIDKQRINILLNKLIHNFKL
jgi:hypothetical protein